MGGVQAEVTKPWRALWSLPADGQRERPGAAGVQVPALRPDGMEAGRDHGPESRPALADRQDDVPGLLLGFHVPARLDHLLQRVAAIDHRSELPPFDQLLQENNVLLRVARGYREHDLPVTEPRSPAGEKEIPEPVSREIAAARRQRSLAAFEGLLADGVEDHVVLLAVPGEVLAGVVEDGAGAKRLHKLDRKSTRLNSSHL